MAEITEAEVDAARRRWDEFRSLATQLRDPTSAQSRHHAPKRRLHLLDFYVREEQRARAEYEIIRDDFDRQEEVRRAAREERMMRRLVPSALVPRQGARSDQGDDVMTEERSALQRKQRHRFQLLRTLYKRADGDERVLISYEALYDDAGLTNDEGEAALAYLVSEGLAERKTAGHCMITHAGVHEYEQALEVPEEPTEHFPEVVIQNVFHGTVGAVQNGPNATANVQQNFNAPTDQTLAVLLDALRAKLPDVPAKDRPSVEEVVEDVAKEAAKPSPNLLRMQGFLTTLATIQALAIPAGQLAKHFFP